MSFLLAAARLRRGANWSRPSSRSSRGPALCRDGFFAHRGGDAAHRYSVQGRLLTIAFQSAP